MKRSIFLFYLIMPLLIFAQRDSVAVGKIVYQHLTFLESSNERNGEAVLYFNPELSLYIHTAAPKENELKENREKLKIIPIAGDKEGFPVYKNIQTGELQYKRMMGGYICIINDTLDKMDWKIHPDKKKFGTYTCQKAVGNFAGRKYEVWFTPEIPVASGPYKLWGLPGMILEAKSTDGRVNFVFKRVEIGHTDFIMSRPENGRQFESLADYHAACEAKDRMLMKKAKARGSNVSIKKIKADWQIEKEDN